MGNNPTPEFVLPIKKLFIPKKTFKSQIKKHFYAYLFISPFFILFLIFFLYPTISSFSLSFYEWEGFNTTNFVGWNNYIKLMRDSLFLETVINSFIIMSMTLVPQIFFATIIAVR